MPRCLRAIGPAAVIGLRREGQASTLARMNTEVLAGRADQDRAFVGHPKGLGYLSFAEGWERFSYYSMQTLLVLYMVRQLLLPGHIEHIAGFAPLRAALEHLYGGPLSTIELASAIFGLYAGLVYLTPIAGGLIADRWIGKTWAVTGGAVLMTAGHFLMAFELSFLIALACLLIGVGLFKGNIASQVGELYAPDVIGCVQLAHLAGNVALEEPDADQQAGEGDEKRHLERHQEVAHGHQDGA